MTCIPTDVLAGEDHGEARVLAGDSQGGNKLDGVGERRVDSHVPPSQC